MTGYRDILERLALGREVGQDELARLVCLADQERVLDYARGLAREVRTEWFGHGVYVRGLVEISNRCSGGCYYCGLRAENRAVERYALSEEEIIEACRKGYQLGLRSFVLQGGERHDIEEPIARLVGEIKRELPDVAITLSLGEQSRFLWSAPNPKLYRLTLYTKRDGKPREYISFRLGAGESTFADGKLKRNGK